MDSKLVIEQMAGRWKIKHPDMKPLAIKAQSLAPFGTEWTWVPRAQNSAADALANMALDGKPVPLRPSEAARAAAVRAEAVRSAEGHAGLGCAGRAADPADLPAARRDTAHRGQAVLRFRWRRPGAERDRRGAGAGGRAVPGDRSAAIDAVVVVADAAYPADRAGSWPTRSGSTWSWTKRWVECSFGDWDGHTFAEMQQKWPDALNAWMESTTVAPPGGESFDTCARRARSARDWSAGDVPGQDGRRGHPRDADQADGPVGAAGPDGRRCSGWSCARRRITEIHWYADGLASLKRLQRPARTSLTSTTRHNGVVG